MSRQTLELRLQQLMKENMEYHHQRLTGLARTLDTVSPLATLGRGYSIVRDAQGELVRSSADVNIGDQVDVQLHKGSLTAKVEQQSS